MTDPRTISGWTEQMRDADERAYVAHLEAHEPETVPERQPGDSIQISTLFDMIAAREDEISTMRQLINALRKQKAQQNSEDTTP
jgi:hypothetical protein